MEDPVEEHSLGSRGLLQSGHYSGGRFWRSQETCQREFEVAVELEVLVGITG